MKNEWEQQAEKALGSLDGIRRASANPFLYTRIKARLEEQHNQWARLAAFISRPAIALSLTVCFVGMNAWVVVKHPLKSSLVKPASENELTFEPEYATVSYSLGDGNLNDK